MADPELLALIKKGVEAWNAWRRTRWILSEVVDLKQADLSGNLLDGANLAYADLTRANLSGAKINFANLENATLVKAKLRNAELSQSNLAWADMSGANLARASLVGATLYGANRTTSNLRKSDLIGTNLTAARLYKARLFGSRVAGTTFADVDLAHTSGLDSVEHLGPSSIGIDTIYKSNGKISENSLPSTSNTSCAVYPKIRSAPAFQTQISRFGLTRKQRSAEDSRAEDESALRGCQRLLNLALSGAVPHDLGVARSSPAASRKSVRTPPPQNRVLLLSIGDFFSWPRERFQMLILSAFREAGFSQARKIKLFRKDIRGDALAVGISPHDRLPEARSHPMKARIRAKLEGAKNRAQATETTQLRFGSGVRSESELLDLIQGVKESGMWTVNMVAEKLACSPRFVQARLKELEARTGRKTPRVGTDYRIPSVLVDAIIREIVA